MYKRQALRGSAQIGFTIISLTISLIAVLIPLLFMGDVVGRLFHEFSITLAVTIVISAVVSLTLVPMMCAKLIRHHPERDRSAFDLKAEQVFDAIIARYGRALNWVLDRQRATLAVALLTLAVTVLLYVVIPKGFFPVQDTGMIQAITEASQSVSYDAMSTLQNQLAEAVLKDPDVESLSSFVGVDGTNETLNTGRFLITLKPHDDRNLTASQIISRIQNEVSGVVGITLYMQPVSYTHLDVYKRQAMLIGRPPAELTLAPRDLAGGIPKTPVTVPSTLLERRPDIAASERTMQQENALIGVAEAGYFPDISLSSMIEYLGPIPLPFNATRSIGSRCV